MLRSTVAGLVLAFAGTRANLGRTLLSCAGIVVGVGALVAVVTIGDVGARIAASHSETNFGRSATLQVDLAERPRNLAAFETDLRRAGATAATVDLRVDNVVLRGDGTVVPGVAVTLTDASLSEIRRLETVRGRWFTGEDRRSLAPVLVVNESLAAALGDGSDVQIGSRRWLEARVVGVLEDTDLDGGWPAAYLLRSPAAEELTRSAPDPRFGSPLSYRVLVDPDDTDAEQYTRRLGSASWRWGLDGTDGAQAVTAWRIDQVEMVDEVVDTLSSGLLWVAAATLATGLLGVLNVGLVTVRERRRELATYRALGAGSPTLFVTVVTEAVIVATVAGAIALAACFAGAWAADRIAAPQLPSDVSVSVPVEAVLVGLSSAAAVGLLAGVLPAWRALRTSVLAGLRE